MKLAIGPHTKACGQRVATILASALLQGAIEYARSRGVKIVEAYPIDKRETHAGDAMGFGAKSMYAAAGFTEVACRKPTRPVVRLVLDRPCSA